MDQKANDNDERVMRELARGDDAALDELMRRWQVPIRCFVQRMLGNQSADDVCQEVWTRLFIYRKRYDTNRAFRPYLFSIAVNCCRSAIVKRSRGIQFSFDSPQQDDMAADTPNPADAASAAERSAALHRAINGLSEMQRAVVLLYMLFDTDYSRIADVLERKVSTVRSQMHHALRRLRRTLTTISLAGERQVDHERMD